MQPCNDTSLILLLRKSSVLFILPTLRSHSNSACYLFLTFVLFVPSFANYKGRPGIFTASNHTTFRSGNNIVFLVCIPFSLVILCNSRFYSTLTLEHLHSFKPHILSFKAQQIFSCLFFRLPFFLTTIDFIHP